MVRDPAIGDSSREAGVGGGGVLPKSRLMGMCLWLGSHFNDWIDYYGVAFL